MGLHEEIAAKVSKVLVESLGVDEEEIQPEAKLVGDLGAVPIDLLDIQFRLEREFKTRIPFAVLFPNVSIPDDHSRLTGRILTDEELEDLEARCPTLDIGCAKARKGSLTFDDLFTVAYLHRYVEHCLQPS